MTNMHNTSNSDKDCSTATSDAATKISAKKNTEKATSKVGNEAGASNKIPGGKERKYVSGSIASSSGHRFDEEDEDDFLIP